MRPEQKNPLGQVGHALRERIAAARRAYRLTYVELSERLTNAGRRIPPLGLSRIERGERRVDADDLVAIAAALSVPVPVLLGLADTWCKNCGGKPPAGFICSTCGLRGAQLASSSVTPT
jgi:transcriptional regulator with XRE-family HTH domain